MVIKRFHDKLNPLFETLKGRSPLSFIKRYTVRIPYSLTNGNIQLRRLRFSDFPFLTDGLKNQGIFLSHELHKPEIFLWLSVWWWIKTTFTVIYCIEFSSKRIGFIGLYNFIPGTSAEISLVVFDKMFRKQGYGTKAFKLLLQWAQRYRLVKEIHAKVSTKNYGAILFWRKVGFLKINTVNDINQYVYVL